MFCTNCGASNKDDARFCVNCAESLGEIQIETKFSQPILQKDMSYLKKFFLLRVLFDFSFNQFVSPKIFKFLYGLSMLCAALIALLFVIAGFKNSMGFGFLALFIGTPLIFLLTVIYSRVLLEMVLVIFRISEHLAEIDTASAEEKPESREGIQWNI
jgi:fatty acid desaturase